MSLHVDNPYLVPGKRARAADSSYNPNIARRLDVGTQTVKGIVDGVRISQNMQEIGGVLPPVSLNAHAVHYGDGVFMLESDGNEPTPLIQKLINGMDAQFVQQYPSDVQMQILALKQTIRPLGVAGEAVKITPDNNNPQVSIKYMGLHSPEVVSCRAGARVVFDVRQYHSSADANRQSGSDQASEIANSFGLVMVSYSEETAGKQFNKMASLLVNDSLTWERALTNYYGKARPWLSAVMGHFRNCQTAFILGIELSLKQGLLQVPGQTTSNVVQYRDNTGNLAPRVPVELYGPVGAAGPAPLTSYELAARFANFMGLTAPTDTLMGILGSDADDAWQLFTHKLAETIYYTANASTGGNLHGSVNAAVEFGAEYNAVNGAVFAGRHENYQVKDDRIGEVVKLQCNSTSQAVSAFLQANGEVDKWLVGTGMSGGTDNRALIMMHK